MLTESWHFGVVWAFAIGLGFCTLVDGGKKIIHHEDNSVSFLVECLVTAIPWAILIVYWFN